MDYQLNTRLNGNIAMTSSYHERASLQRDKTLYKFIWVQSGTLTLEIDHIPIHYHAMFFHICFHFLIHTSSASDTLLILS